MQKCNLGQRVNATFCRPRPPPLCCCNAGYSMPAKTLRCKDVREYQRQRNDERKRATPGGLELAYLGERPSLPFPVLHAGGQGAVGVRDGIFVMSVPTIWDTKIPGVDPPLLQGEPYLGTVSLIYAAPHRGKKAREKKEERKKYRKQEERRKAKRKKKRKGGKGERKKRGNEEKRQRREEGRGEGRAKGDERERRVKT